MSDYLIGFLDHVKSFLNVFRIFVMPSLVHKSVFGIIKSVMLLLIAGSTVRCVPYFYIFSDLSHLFWPRKHFAIGAWNVLSQIILTAPRPDLKGGSNERFRKPRYTKHQIYFLPQIILM
jgi:hypothetical protein